MGDCFGQFLKRHLGNLHPKSVHALTATAHRALQNPEIFTSQHYRQAAIAVAAGIAIRLLIALPVCFSAA